MQKKLAKFFSYFILNKEDRKRYRTEIKLGANIIYPAQLFSYLLKILDFIIPKNTKQIIFFSNPNFTDNPRAYYDYIAKNQPHYKCIWLYDDVIWIKTLKRPIKKSFYIHTFKAWFLLATSKYIIWNHSQHLNKYIIGSKHIILQLWHGMPIKTIGHTEKGISKQLKNSYTFFGKYGYFFATSDIFKHLINSTFKCDYSKIYITGEPKTDFCFYKSSKKIASLIQSNHKKTVLFMPTYKQQIRFGKRDVNTNFDNIFYMQDYNEEHFTDFLKKNDILFLIKPHPFDELAYIDFFKSKQLPSNFKLILNLDLVSNNLNINELFPYTDMLITDFSSTSINYLITGKPVIYMTQLVTEYDENRGFMYPDNYEQFMIGDNVNNYKTLVNTINKNLNSPDTTTKKTRINLLHKYYDDKSSERIYEIMKEL